VHVVIRAANLVADGSRRLAGSVPQVTVYLVLDVIPQDGRVVLDVPREVEMDLGVRAA
jgi:hypothetical protein